MVFLSSAFIFPQEKQADPEKNLREEILAVYQSKGEQGLRDFVKKQKDKITNKFIVDFAEAGLRGRKEEWLKICEIMAEEKEDEKTVAEIYYKIGTYFKVNLDYKRAIDFFGKALPIYEKINDFVGQGKVFLGKVDIYIQTGRNSRAKKMLDKILNFFDKGGSIIGQGHVYFRKGDISLFTDNKSNALEMYDKALTFFEKKRYLWGLGNVYVRKGDIYYGLCDEKNALEMYDKANSFFKEAGDMWGQGDIYLRKGMINSRKGDISNVLEIYNKSLHFFKKGGSFVGQGDVYYRKGDIYWGIGDNSKAFEMYDKALQLFKKAGDSIRLGYIYSEKGGIYLYTGDYTRSLEMYNKALHFFEKAENPGGQGNVYNSKGEIYLRKSDYSRAFEELDKALFFFKKAEDYQGQGNVYCSKGEIYFLTGDNSSALDMYEKAMPFYQKTGFPLSQGNVYRGKGDIFLKNGEYSKALKMYENAFVLYSKIGDIESESHILHRQAKVLEKQGKKDEALSLFEKGISKLEKVRYQTSVSEMKKTFMEMVYRQYEEAAVFMLGNKYYDKSFKYTETMKARVFIDQLAEGLAKLNKGIEPEFKKKRDNLVAKLSLLGKNMHKTAGKNDENELLELKKQYRDVKNDFEDLLVKIRLNNSMYASVRYPQPVSVQPLREDILIKGELLLRYFISPDKLYVFIISKENFKVVSIKLKEKEIKSIVKNYLQAVGENSSRGIKKYGKTLYKKLFKPLEASIKESTDIIIIPDGDLAKIPFESLILDKKKSGRPVFLIEKYQVKYVQSASILSVLRKQYTRTGESKSFISFGDPIYDYENFKQGKPEQGTITRSPEDKDEIREVHRSRYARAGGIMNRLFWSGKEVKAIARLFEKKPQKCAVLLREQATEESAKAAEMKGFDFIHFACHGILNDDFQCLVLSQDIPSAKEDGYFTLNEIMNCDYNAKLVVLSACQTGSGKIYRAEGVTGLTRAVMYAGTPAVIATLWDVDDTATKELMVNFYSNMLEKNLDKVEALRQAKLELLKDKKYSSPFFWSAFVMYGE
jgi:CHAT domain-containing protein/Tfp pilus assembly protein PilF